jgi:tetratricopeptide (TPR) repeat protein
VRDRTRAPLSALLFFGLTLGPALGFVNVYPFRYAFVADHFQYLASAGIFALAAAAIVTAVPRWLQAASASWLAFIVVLPLALVTWRDSHAYAGVDELYRTTIARSPNAWLARTNLAALLLDQKPPALEEALAYAREAVRLAPLEASTRFNLGMALEQSGNPAGAVEEYRAAIAHATAADRRTIRVALVHERLARVLHDLGRDQESAEEAEKATTLLADLTKLNTEGGSRSVEGQADAGIALLQSGRAAEAAQALAGLVDQVPQRLDARFALGMAFEQTGQFDRAVAQFHAVIAVQPAHAGATQHLGRALHALGRRDEAIAVYQSALALDPTSAETHNDLGAALAESGRIAEAESHFADAVRLKPDYASARNNLAQARKLLGK